MSQLLTIQENIFTNDINGLNGRLFKVNHQFLFTGMIEVVGGCCGVNDAFIVVCNNTTYYIPSNKAVATTIVIPKHDQDFDHQLYKVFLQNKDDHSYAEINNNCTNCNGQIPHGDYSNNGLTPGYKIPDLVFKDND